MTSYDNPPEIEVVETADGSSTGRHAGTGATYRSVFGAVTEVRHVFIESTGLHGLEPGGTWSVLELGFGLGTSFVETARVATEQGVELRYTSVERQPATPNWVQHDWEPGRSMAAEALAALHESSESRRIEVERPGISLVVLRTDWLDAEPDSLADALYFDPFGPSANPESWTDAMFEAARARLKPAGRLATYSAAGHVRRAMARAGLVLATRPGPGRKREITVASPADAGLGNLERLSMTRYRREEPT